MLPTTIYTDSEINISVQDTDPSILSKDTGNYTVWIGNIKNPINSGWQFFDESKEAFEFANKIKAQHLEQGVFNQNG
tara:strand:- start:155 stop:385 length:231 start_codon:yes stop_codon:yes gene_type:complete